MRSHGYQPPVPGGFPDGLRVLVSGGQFDGDKGQVVNQAPDLRPGTVWVALTAAGTRLVPGYRLTIDTGRTTVTT